MEEVFSAPQQEDLKSYFTAMDIMLFGLTKKQCRRLVFDFAEECAKTSDHDAVGDATDPQILVVENQHINPPEEPELKANAVSDAPKMSDVSVLNFKPLPKATQCEKTRKRKKVSSSILTSTSIKEILEERETLRKQRKEACETKKGVKNSNKGPVVNKRMDPVPCQEVKSGGMRNVPIMKMAFSFVTIVSCTTKHFNITLQ
ncbi:hypothetical protein TNCV_4604631 [Trichonephila clavipes]|nr:hypothetical protein TNCV_4604631 [Trichonephila clavipes]